MGPAGLRLGAFLIAVLAVSSAAAAPKPSWQAAPGAALHSQALVWSAGRLWFVKGLDDGSFRLLSARLEGRRLVGWTTARARLAAGPAWLYLGQLRDELVFASSAAAAGQVVALPLLASGQTGEARDLAGAPPPESSAGSKVVQLPDRAVRLVGVDTGREFLTATGVCCAPDGRVVTYASFLKPGAQPIALLGLDRRGRLWLAWYTTRPPRSGKAGIVELDPVTLQPRGEPQLVPGLTRGFVRVHALVCGDTCRLLVSGFGSRRFVDAFWTPGESTTLRFPTSCATPCSVDATTRGGRLTVVYVGGRGESRTIAVAQGDVRGRGLRLVSSIGRPGQLGFDLLSTIPFGAFGPGLYATVAAYTGAKTTVRVALLPLRATG